MMIDKNKSGKRKGADVGGKDVKTSKKAKVISASGDATDIVVPVIETQSKPSRKRAADLFDAVEVESVQTAPDAVVTKKIKKAQLQGGADSNDKPKIASIGSAAQNKPVSQKTKQKQAPKKGKVEAVTEKVANDFEGFESSDNEDEIDTAKLLAGFETSSESGSDNEEGIPIENIPQPPPANAKAVKAAETRRAQQANTKDDSGGGGGTLYIGRIPHGFYERQMHAYFSQFGTIKRLRLARNKKTGAPKHYAFIEFASADVADIVQRTMDKYLLFNHILQVRKMADEEVHEKLWRGSEKRFKVVPWGAMQARALRAPRERDVWSRRVQREQGRRSKRKAVLDAYGYEFEAPALKAVADVVEHEYNGGDALNADQSAAAIEQEEVVAEAIESGAAVPQEIVEANTIANGGEPLDGPVPADEVTLKHEHKLKQQQQELNPSKTRSKTKAKRNVSAPILAQQDADVTETKQKKGKKGGKGRISI